MELQSYWIVGIFWTLYLAIHSILASEIIKNYVKGSFPNLFMQYRAAYNIFALTSLLLFVGYYATIKPTYFYSADHTWLKFLGLVSSTFAVIIVKAAFSKYSTKEFLGLKSESTPTLVTNGIQARVRHPLYSGTILLFFGLLLFMPSLENLASFICVSVYIPIGIYFEEKKLMKQFGDAYQAYRDQVPMLVPRIGKL